MIKIRIWTVAKEIMIKTSTVRRMMAEITALIQTSRLMIISSEVTSMAKRWMTVKSMPTACLMEIEVKMKAKSKTKKNILTMQETSDTYQLIM